MDQEIIRSLKGNFRKNLVLKMNHCILQRSTIRSCFRHSGLIKNHDHSQFQILENQFDVVPLSLWSSYRNVDSAKAPEIWEEYVDIVNALITCEEPTYENIVQNINAIEQFGSE
ncbi:uncharacterized protein LOC113374390 [Ctenocephalides felis]|uniref:uncharacterized protein LOC113374390 n=1 Tax=Ctenocephalides felis TaxID=7515 RepID=UPI000E6E538F|nr:uncharacterized protein LOC113374390 [Ctenocephalides felis]